MKNKTLLPVNLKIGIEADIWSQKITSNFSLENKIQNARNNDLRIAKTIEKLRNRDLGRKSPWTITFKVPIVQWNKKLK